MKKTALVIAAIGFFLFAQAAPADWDPTKRLTFNSGQSMNPAFALYLVGGVYVVWDDNSAGDTEIYFRASYDAGESWEPTKRLTWNAGGSYTPAITVDPSGSIYVVWCDDTPGNYEIYCRKSSDEGATWGPTSRLTWNLGHSLYPAIAADLTNNIHVVWQDDTMGNYEVNYRKSTDGGATWGATKRLASTPGNSQNVAIATAAMDSGVGLHVVWQDETPGLAEIYYTGSSDGGETWSAAKRLSWNSAESYDPAIAVDSKKQVHVFWSDAMPGNYEILYGKSKDGGATWTPTRRLTFNADGSYEPAAALDGAGNPYIVWNQGTLSNTEIYFKESTDKGATWGAAQRLTWTPLRSYSPALAIVSSVYETYFHVVWYEDTPGSFEIYYKMQMKGLL